MLRALLKALKNPSVHFITSKVWNVRTAVAYASKKDGRTEDKPTIVKVAIGISKKHTPISVVPYQEQTIIKLTSIGVGVSGIASFTEISKSNIINKIRQISEKTVRPEIKEEQQTYEVNEMHTFINNKKNACYITYVLNKTDH